MSDMNMTELGALIGNEVRRVMASEMKPGGLLNQGSRLHPAHDGCELIAGEAGHPFAALAVVGNRPERSNGVFANRAVYRFDVATIGAPLEKCPLVLNKLLRFRLLRNLLHGVAKLFLKLGHASLKAFIFLFESIRLFEGEVQPFVHDIHGHSRPDRMEKVS